MGTGSWRSVAFGVIAYSPTKPIRAVRLRSCRNEGILKAYRSFVSFVSITLARPVRESCSPERTETAASS